MNFLRFKTEFKDHPLFSIKDIYKKESHFNKMNLVNWHKKDLIHKIRNSWYRFTDLPLEQNNLFLISNKIYQPSYISLETALSYYGIIPEAVFSITAISTLKTNQFTYQNINFNYKSIKPNLFFGYQLVNFKNHTYKMASIEKTILDTLYFNKNINKVADFYALRFNKQEINTIVNFKKLKDYNSLYNSKIVTKKLNLFLKFLKDDKIC